MEKRIEEKGKEKVLKFGKGELTSVVWPGMGEGDRGTPMGSASARRCGVGRSFGR